MINDKTNRAKRSFDLEERTSLFAERVIDFANIILLTPINKILLIQLVKAATSIGANYMEANAASSRKDFKNKISYCRKESSETKYWLRMVGKSRPDLQTKCLQLWQEAHELTLIFSKIIFTIESSLSQFKIKN